MGSADSEAIDVALRVADALEGIGTAYFVGGSVASSMQGEPRATNDIDIVVDMKMGHVSKLRQALGQDFEVDEAMLRDALLRGECANIFYLPLVMKIDLFGLAHGPFDESEFSRRQKRVVRSDGATLWMKSPEDTVLRKLIWYRLGGEVSDQQWRDIVSVLRISAAELDNDYLDRWAKQLNLETLLSRARSAAV